MKIENVPTKYSVIRDTREQQGWFWDETELCAGTIVETLKTGDYTLAGLPEKYFVIERKSDTGELAKNINEGRLEDELKRMEEFQHPFIVAECSWDDVYSFPENSGIPKKLWGNLKISKYFLAKRIVEWELKYKTKIILAGSAYGKHVASSLFKRIIESLHG